MGFWAKQDLSRSLSGPASSLLLVAMVGTAAVYARLCLRPLQWPLLGAWPPLGTALLALALLVGGLVLAPLPPQGSLFKAVAVLAAGLGLQQLLDWGRNRQAGHVLVLPRLEGLQDLLGGMALVGSVLMGLLWRGGVPWPA